MAFIRTAAKGVFWTTTSTITRSIVNLLQYSILAHYLAQDEFGVIAIATLCIGFTQIFLDMGISAGILHKQNITGDEYSSLYWLNIIAGLLITCILQYCSTYIVQFYNEPELHGILSLLSLTILFSAIGSQYRIVLQKELQFCIVSVIDIVASISVLVSSIILVTNNYGVYSLVISTVCGVMVSNILCLYIGITKIKTVRFHFCLRETYPFLKIGVYSVGTQILDFFSREIDTLIISIFLSKDQLGVYSLLKKLVTAMYSMIGPIMNNVLTPLLSLLQTDKNNMKDAYYKLIESLAIVITPVFMLTACLSYAIVYYVYGSNFCEDSAILCVAAVYYAYLVPGSTITPLQIATGRTDSGFYWTIIRILINTSTIYLSVRYGIIAMTLSLLLVNILFSPVAWRITIKPLIGGSFFSYYKKRFTPYLVLLFFSSPLYYFVCDTKNSIKICVVILLFAVINVILLFTFYRNSYVSNLIVVQLQRMKNRS